MTTEPDSDLGIPEDKPTAEPTIEEGTEDYPDSGTGNQDDGETPEPDLDENPEA